MAEATRRITHVIFDLDGTLLDTEPLYFRAYQEVMARYGFEYTLETANALRGIPTSIGVPRLLAETQLPLDAERFIEQLEEILFRLYPTAQATEGALRLTEHLACEGVPIAIATSSNARQLASKITAHEDWLGSFRAVVCADEVENGKPAPDLFIEAARRLGASPPRCLVFEDAPAGVAAARAASMAVVAIPEDGFGEAVADADLVIPSLAMFDPEPWGLPPFED